MSGSLTLADICRTPEVLRRLVARGDEIAAFTRQHLLPDPGGRLYAFGCGDGLCASEAMASEHFLARTALDFRIYDAPSMRPSDRALAISMSGNVDRGLEAVEAAMTRGLGIGYLTNGGGGRLGQTGMPTLSLDIPVLSPETLDASRFLCGTSSYTATLYTLLMITGTIENQAPALDLHRLDGLAERADTILQALPPSFAGARFLSAGCNRGTTSHGAEKLVEITQVPSWSADIEEFAHSQFWASRPGELVVYYAAHPDVAALATHSAAVLNDMGFHTVAIETESCPVPDATFRVSVPDCDERVSPIPFAIVTQVLARQLALRTGVDPDRRAHLKGDPLRFRTSRRLTRQALVGTGR